jgi:hypothetical protein
MIDLGTQQKLAAAGPAAAVVMDRSPINKGAWRMAFSNGQVTGATPGGSDGFTSPVWQQLPGRETGPMVLVE